MREKPLTGCSPYHKMRHREKLVLEFWDRSKKLSIKNSGYRNFANELFELLLKNDIKNGDLTTESMITSKPVSACVVAKENGILAGIDEFKLLNKGLRLKFLKKDGDKIKSGDILIKIEGNANKILEKERISLNVLQRMSGIATLTNNLTAKLSFKIKIAATRKTLWGSLDKKAVSIGGGLTHRLNLSDGILVKDNHLKILDCNIEKAFELIKKKSRYVEIEVENRKQVFAAAETVKKIKEKTLFAMMFDKINPDEIKSIVEDFKNRGLYDKILFEASGNINEDNLKNYADCGVDVISMGCLTNSAKTLNISLEIE